MSYQPRTESKIILDKAFELIISVGYRVSARWLFYGLLQQGFFKDKNSYKSNFLPLIAKARKEFYNGWNPDTLADDTRISVIRGKGFDDEKSWYVEVRNNLECELDKWKYQERYIEIWFEAKAMRGQFEYYTKHITLRPFGGDPSIPYKWTIAKDLEYINIPTTILYFGDYDPKGLSIPLNAVKDIRSWCNNDFEFVRCGLNKGDELRYAVPDNPSKPNTYQWEALNDITAGTLISNAVNEYIDVSLFEMVEEEQQQITNQFRNKLDELFV